MTSNTRGGYYGFLDWYALEITKKCPYLHGGKGTHLGFRTFRRAKEIVPVVVLLERGGSWHNNTEVYMRPALVWGGVAEQGSILRGFRTWRQVRRSIPRG